VPATITGAFRAWPYFRLFPKPARILVRYHDPIDPADYKGRSPEDAVEALLAELRRRVERSLLPGVKADLRISVLYRTPAPAPRLHEYAPALAFALLVFWKTRSFAAVAPAYGYLAYLLLDQFVIPQRRLVKWARNASSFFFVLLYGGLVLSPALGLPPVPAQGALLSVMCGAGFAYLYERGRVAVGFGRGVVLTACLELLALQLSPTGVGPHVALPLFAAAYGWERRTVFWRYAAPLLLVYAAVTSRWLLGGAELLPHAVAGLLAAFVTRLFPERGAVVEAEPPPTTTSLGLR
jgi:hypothetical protein